jgi:hypothetical protein
MDEMDPDETIFREHLGSDTFLAGVARRMWKLCGGLEGINWPHPIFSVQAMKEFIPSGGVFLRFDLRNYPQQAPTACPWNVETNSPLDPPFWPKGPGNVSRVFNPNWNRSALYAPCDRVAMINHEHWVGTHAAWWWKCTFSFVRYLEFVHICLNPCGSEEQRS